MLLMKDSQWIATSQALPMIEKLIPQIEASNDLVAANVLHCIGELSMIAGNNAKPCQSQLLGLILPRLTRDVANIKSSSLKALGQICSSTGYVIQPLNDHPELMRIC